jgi:hypothetical protein
VRIPPKPCQKHRKENLSRGIAATLSFVSNTFKGKKNPLEIKPPKFLYFSFIPNGA